MRKHLVVLAVAGVALAGCSAGSDDPATADAKAACSTLDRMGTLDYSKKSVSIYEFGAAVELATAAAGRDSKYALTKAQTAAQRTFDPGNDTTKTNLKKAKDFCGDL
ncbi:MAG TPA: hypothetical protein VGN37_22410 [Actinocatenispora sp.]